jgi:hypothetical protein
MFAGMSTPTARYTPASRHLFRHFFAKKFEHALRERMEQEAKSDEGRSAELPATEWSSRFSTAFRSNMRHSSNGAGDVELDSPANGSELKKRSRPASFMRRLRPDMIHRVNAAPRLVNPSGWVDEESHQLATAPQIPQFASSEDKMAQEVVTSPQPMVEPRLATVPESRSSPTNDVVAAEGADPLATRFVPSTFVIFKHELSLNLGNRKQRTRRRSDPGLAFAAHARALAMPPYMLTEHIRLNVTSESKPFARFKTVQVEDTPNFPPRTHTIEFAHLDPPYRSPMGPRSPVRTQFQFQPADGGADISLRRTFTADRRTCECLLKSLLLTSRQNRGSPRTGRQSTWSLRAE